MRRAWNHNLHYHALVLRAVARPCARALDVGCGEGVLTRALAAGCGEVVGIDLDAGVLREGRDTQPANVRFVVGDAMFYPFREGPFDFIAAVATLHHLPLHDALARLRGLLRPGGVLAIVGLYRAATVQDYVWAAVAWPASWAVRCFRRYAKVQACTRRPAETLREIKQAAEVLLPGARVKRRLFFRYSLVWRKPELQQ